MATYTPIELAAARALARRFGVEATAVTPIAAGSVNSNYRLESVTGASYLLRIYEEASAADAETEARLLRRLAAAGLPTPCPLPRCDGAGVSVPASDAPGQRPVSLFPWRDGDMLCQARVTPPAATRVGAALARTHLALAGADESRPDRFGPDALRARLRTIAAAPDPSLGQMVPVIDARLARAATALDPTLPRGIVHGDLFRDNVLWRDGVIVALLDFESAAEGSFAYDLMVTVLAWCYGDDLDLALVRSMLDGYQGVRPLSARERQALGPEGRMAALRFTVTRITDFTLRPAREAHAMKDWRRFWARLARLDALGDAALTALASR